MPAERVFYLLALATVLGVVGVVVPSLGRVALALDVGLLVVFALDGWRARRQDLQARRIWPPLLSQGAETEVVVELLAPPGPDVRVRLRDALSPALAESARRVDLTVPGGQRVRWTVPIRPRFRGEHTVGPVTVRILGPWRLAWSQRRLVEPEVRRIYPQVRWDGRVGQLLMLAHRHALGHLPQSLQGLGTEPYALRDYRPGDPLGRIHWKATARHGRPISREDTWERSGRLLILLDCGRAMASLEGERSKLDHALAAALALIRVATARGDRVVLVAFSDRIERTLRLHGGQKSASVAYEALYDLEARLAEPAFDLAVDTLGSLESRRSTAVLLTSVVDLGAADLLRQAILRLERRHRPILINLRDPELSHLACDPVTTAEEAFAKGTALEILLANRRLGQRLRRAGIRAVGTSADRLALETLEAYLSLFSGRGQGRRGGRGRGSSRSQVAG